MNKKVLIGLGLVGGLGLLWFLTRKEPGQKAPKDRTPGDIKKMLSTPEGRAQIQKETIRAVAGRG